MNIFDDKSLKELALISTGNFGIFYMETMVMVPFMSQNTVNMSFFSGRYIRNSFFTGDSMFSHRGLIFLTQVS